MEKNIKSIKEIFAKLIYVLEFFVSIAFVKSIFDFICAKEYYEQILVSRIFLMIVGAIALIGIAVYVLKKYKGIPEKLFLLFVIPIGIGFTIFMMPLTVPDEGSHIIRAYDISVGHIFTVIDENGESSSTAVSKLENYDFCRFMNYSILNCELSKQTDYNENIQAVTSAQGYSPLLYIGPATAFVIARLLKINIWLAIYFGRVLNFIIFLIFGYFSIKKIPFGKNILAVLLCTPMLIQQAASCSSDVILNSVLVYYLAYLIYLIFKQEEFTRKDRIILYILTALVGMFKYIYVLVAGILFIKLLKEKENKKSILKIIIIMIIIGATFSILSFAFFTRYTTIDERFERNYTINHVNVGEQVEYIKNNLGTFIGTVARTYYDNGFSLLLESIGWKLGSYNIVINEGIPFTFLILLLTAAITSENRFEFSKKEKIWVIALFFLITFVIFLAMFIFATGVGNNTIFGIQGRYFTPLILIVFLCFINKNVVIKIKNILEKLLTTTFILNVMALATVIITYL